VHLLARDAQANIALIVAQCLSIHLCVCPRQLESRVCTQHCVSRATSTTGLCVSVCVCLSMCVCVCVHVFLSSLISVCISVCLPVCACLSVYVSLCLCLSVCVSCSAQTTITHLKKFVSLKLFETLDRFREVTTALSLFLSNRTNGRAYGTTCLSVVCNVYIVAKWYILGGR